MNTNRLVFDEKRRKEFEKTLSLTTNIDFSSLRLRRDGYEVKFRKSVCKELLESASDLFESLTLREDHR